MYTVPEFRLKAPLFMVLALVAVACNASGREEPSAQLTPTSILQISLTPESVVSAEERLLASIPIAGGPDEVIYLQDSVWVRMPLNGGHVMQIDPTTNTVVADIAVDKTSDGNFWCEGLGTDGESVWSCSARGDHETGAIDVVRIDPASKEVVQTGEVDKIWDQLNLPFLAGHIWVLAGDGDQLVGVNTDTGELAPAIDLGSRCFELSPVGDSLFASCRLDNVILQIDPESGEITRRIDVKSPIQIDGNEDSFWVVAETSILRLDAETLQPIAQWNLGGGWTNDIYVTDDAVWVRRKDDFLYRIDPVSNKIVEQIQYPEEIDPGSLLVTAEDIWTTGYHDSVLLRLSLPE